jgi:transposase
MQLKVLGAERRRRWSYDEKVRLVEETLRKRCVGITFRMRW